MVLTQGSLLVRLGILLRSSNALERVGRINSSLMSANGRGSILMVESISYEKISTDSKQLKSKKTV